MIRAKMDFIFSSSGKSHFKLRALSRMHSLDNPFHKYLHYPPVPPLADPSISLRFQTDPFYECLWNLTF